MVATNRTHAARQLRIEEYFRSISREFNALKDRVRYLIHDSHWQTDGEWKESVLRSVLQRTIPRNMAIGRGFIVGNRETSSQIDIIVYDSSYPILYKDGDLVFISPASCRAIIEVKTSVTATRFSKAIRKLADNAEIARLGANECRPVFTGLLVYEDAHLPNMLRALQRAAGGRHDRIVDHVSIGPSSFVKFWTNNPDGDPEPYKQWHEYHLREMAQGYFAHNLSSELAPSMEARWEQMWFPESGKEGHLVGREEFQIFHPEPLRSFSSTDRHNRTPRPRPSEF